jgi:CRP-like cAMP-binding protein
MLSGSCAGELTFISRTPRNAKVTAEVDSSLFKLDVDGLAKMESELPALTKELMRILLRGSLFSSLPLFPSHKRSVTVLTRLLCNTSLTVTSEEHDRSQAYLLAALS